MNICISGATGFLGQGLVNTLIQDGHSISVISRSESKALAVFGESVHILLQDEIEKHSLDGIEVVIHLAGAPLFHFPRTTAYKQQIIDSRVETTKKLVSVLPSSCHTYIGGSAIGYYPSSLTSTYDESFINTSPTSFLENTCIQRETEALVAKTSTRRVVLLRTGLVEGDQGIRKKITQATRWFGGVVLGSGDQFLSLVTHNSRCDTVIQCIDNSSIQGPINLVDRTVTMREYIHEIATALHRPVWLRIPESILSFVLRGLSSLIIDSHSIQSIYFKK